MESDPAPSAYADLLHAAGDESAATAFILGSDDSLSGASSSGEIPALPGALAVPAPPPEEEAAGAAEVEARGGRQRCVGRRGAEMWGAAATVGRRREMEDAMAVVPEFMNLRCEEVGGCSAAPGSGKISHVRFFGVYDGHGGSQVADYCAKRIHEVVAEEWERLNDGQGWQRRWEMAFCDGYERVDNEVIAEAVAPDIVGSTAVVVLVSGCQIISSNCGDSRAVLCRGNQAIQLTVDHKPDREDELTRIENGGGRVINWYGPRVLGVLAMSRAIGDRYMRPHIIPVPEVSFMPRSEDDECLILASDGLWDVMSNEEAGDLASRLLRRHRRNGLVDQALPSPAQAVADDLVRVAYHKNSSDNISIIVVDLKSRSRRRPRQ
ncbi:probable protein phosphatase 2C 6 isoform X2 [Elaeis guineensis]|uniref:probable protein phosphatase 2C 6 isoform X2 n=1 Tax=Elaeis guineensis var. tenera TaxID=51953 RepID=UPI003C6CC5AE